MFPTKVHSEKLAGFDQKLPTSGDEVDGHAAGTLPAIALHIFRFFATTGPVKDLREPIGGRRLMTFPPIAAKSAAINR